MAWPAQESLKLSYRPADNRNGFKSAQINRRGTVESFAVKKEKEVSYVQIGLIALLVAGFAIGFQKVRTLTAGFGSTPE